MTDETKDIDVVEALDKVIDSIIEFEMEGKEDKNDPFYPTVMCLREFREKLLDEEM